MKEKIIEKFIRLTSDVKVDDKGDEHIIPWSLEEFLWEGMLMVVGVIIGAIFF